VLKIVGDQAWERAVRRGWIASTEDVDVFQTRAYHPIVQWQKARRSREVRSVDQVIVPSQYLKQMVAGWGVDPDRIQVIYNALPPAENASLSQSVARERLGLVADTPIVFTAARLKPWKGVDHLIRAVQHVPDVCLIIAGEGPMRAELEHLTVQLNLTLRVTFLGQVSREAVHLYMQAADYFALYSGYEGLPHAALESLRAGTPVIASDKGGNPEVITHNVNGLLVPYVNVEALTAALHTAFQPGKRAGLAANTAAGLDRFDFKQMVLATEKVLQSCL
jgi:glycosyltransferase involved in cell wall biosynthesis